MKFFNKIFFFFFLLFSYSIFSQNSGYKTGVSNILNAANPEDIGVRTAVQVQEDKDDPLEYGYVNDKDILWSTTVWEIIDLDQRVNYPLLYPVDTSVVGDERRPMIWWLKQEIEKFNLPVYDAENTESEGEFIERLPDERVENIFKRRIISDEGREKFKNAIAVIEERISVQYDKYNFNPYEEEISAEEKQILANDSTFNPIFPYTIKKFTGYKELTDEVFSYAQFLGFTSPDGPVRVVQPQGIPEELSQDAINEYTAVLREILDTEFFVEDTDFYYKNFQFEELKQWLIKGIWYFDKKYSELIYRPIGIAPVATSLDEDGAGDAGGGGGVIGTVVELLGGEKDVYVGSGSSAGGPGGASAVGAVGIGGGLYRTPGTSGNGFSGYDINSPGGGAAGDATASEAGPGFPLNWVDGSTFVEYGKGGENENLSNAQPTVPGKGGYFFASTPGQYNPGANGLVLVRVPSEYAQNVTETALSDEMKARQAQEAEQQADKQARVAEQRAAEEGTQGDDE